MIIIDTKFNGLKLFKSNLYNDKSGYLREIFKKKNFNKDLIFHYFAKSKKYVVRGFHFQSINQQPYLYPHRPIESLPQREYSRLLLY